MCPGEEREQDITADIVESVLEDQRQIRRHQQHSGANHAPEDLHRTSDLHRCRRHPSPRWR